MQLTTYKRSCFLCFIAICILIAGCNITGTEYYSPAFTIIQDSVESRIKAITDFKMIEFRAARTKNAEGEIINNGVEIDIIPALPLPGNDSQIKELARQIALPVKQCLKAPKDYNYYEVRFLAQEGINRSLKKETVKVITLETAEL
jgi:hypothetical protein